MTDLVDPRDIERIVGRKRHPRYHFARFDSEKQTFYILHSAECVEKTEDLRDCRYSMSLDLGVRTEDWIDSSDRRVLEDEPVLVNIRQSRLVADPYVVPDERERLRLVFGGRRAWHVQREHNLRVWSVDWAGYSMWTRKGIERRALCGSLRATLVGIDVADWGEGRETINPEAVSCKRCRASYERILARRG